MTSNMANRVKHCLKLEDSTFAIFIDPSAWNPGWKNSLWVIRRILRLFSTHWLPITSIHFLIETIYSKYFRCNYLRNEKYFLHFFFIFFFAFSRLISYFEPFQKKDDTHIWYIFELTDSERRGWINV